MASLMYSSSLCVLITCLLSVMTATADTVELMNGQLIDGTVVEQTAANVTITATAGAGSVDMKIPAGRIHAVTVGGKRQVVIPRPTRTQVDALIQKAGTTPPDWWDSVPLEYPATLDLSWAKPKPGTPWNPQKNVGQYIWSVINENPGKWKSGTKFLHHVLAVNKDNPQAVNQAIGALANTYQTLLQDYARAAFWRRKALQRSPDDFSHGVRLAECYWLLGNKEMAVEQLAKFRRYVAPLSIKLWSDMGNLEEALAEADSLAALGTPDQAYLAAGDACRLHAQYGKALEYYEKVLAVPEGKRYGKITKDRARASIAAIKVFDTLDLKRIPDGTYASTSISYAGPLSVAVEIKNGRIESVKVTKHSDKQYYTAITDTTRRIVEVQGVKGIDAVTSATITCEAIINATAKALAEAMSTPN